MSNKAQSTGTNEAREATRLALSLPTYREFKRSNMLKHCLPQEKCTCGALNGVFNSLLSQYRADDLMKLRTAEYKKGKELFLACLLAYILRGNTKKEYAICIPTEDRGTDIFIREIDYARHVIIMHPLQVCEMPEKHIQTRNSPADFTRAVFEFVKEKKLKHYPKSMDGLLVWIETDANRHLDIVECRQLFNSEVTIPFVQIVAFGRGHDDIIYVASVYSRDKKKDFVARYHYKTNTLEAN